MKPCASVSVFINRSLRSIYYFIIFCLQAILLLCPPYGKRTSFNRGIYVFHTEDVRPPYGGHKSKLSAETFLFIRKFEHSADEAFLLFYIWMDIKVEGS